MSRPPPARNAPHSRCSVFAPFSRSPSAPASKPLPEFTPDKGTFQILVNGQHAGKEEFDIGPSGAGNTGSRTALPKSPRPTAYTNVTGTLEFRADGTPVRYEWSTEGAKKAAATVTFNGPVATIELRIPGARPFTQQFTFSSPKIVILDNNLYHQYAVLAHLYDWDKKGPQTFSVLVPQETRPARSPSNRSATRMSTAKSSTNSA